LCKSHPVYLWSFIVYTEKETILNTLLISKDILKGRAIVLKLSDHLLHKGYACGWIIIIIPSSGHVSGIVPHDCEGTIRVNTKAVPKKLQDSKLQEGEVTAQHSTVDHFVSCDGMTRNM
jgi:hypothetical protein